MGKFIISLLTNVILLYIERWLEVDKDKRETKKEILKKIPGEVQNAYKEKSVNKLHHLHDDIRRVRKSS